MYSWKKLLSVGMLVLAIAGCGRGALSPLGLGRAAGAGTAGISSVSVSDALGPAAALATATLRRNIKDVWLPHDPAKRAVIFAGGGHFGALWTRDGMYGALGLLAIGEHAAVRGSLAALLDSQLADGQVPRRIGSGSNALGILRNAVGLAPHESDHFKMVDFAKTSVDANALVLWVAQEYLAAHPDAEFLAQYRPALDRAAGWLNARVDHGLLAQKNYGDWKDMNARGGKVMYSNALYFRALTAMATISRDAADPVKAAMYQVRADALRVAIQGAFWNARRGHFRDTLVLDDFSPEGDLLAVLFGLATPPQRQAIFARAEALLSLQPLLPALDGEYPPSMIPLMVKLAGLEHYHDRFYWPWLTDLYAWSAAASGDRRRALKALDRTAHLALRDGTFHEIYEGPEPIAVKRRLYASEPDFTWHAGLYLRAYQELRVGR